MKNIITLLFFAFGSLNLFAQQPAAKFPSAALHIFGKITDSTGKAITDASVMLLQNQTDAKTNKSKYVLLKGVATSAIGEFSFEDVPASNKLKIKISAVGFKEFDQAIASGPAGGAGQKPSAPGAPLPGGGMGSEKDLGKIVLASEEKVLSGITITASKSMMKLDIDKKVFNVEKNIVSEGGTGVDVMKNVPSVNVDIDGNVTLRNSAPQLLVDGRPTTLTLDQIPANAIESVEVMTNPSAKYDASGGGSGILNIVLKKNKKTGYNGSVRAGVNKYGATDLGFDFNLRQNKINFTGGVNARVMNSRGSSTLERTNLADSPSTFISQTSSDLTKGNMIFGRFGLDYFVSNKTTFSVSFMRMHGDIQPGSLLNISTDSLYNTGKVSSFSQRNTNGERVFNGQGIIGGMKHLFSKKGKEWTVDANYFSGKAEINSLYTTDYYSGIMGSSVLSSQTQKIVGGGSDRNFVIQTDFVDPITDKIKLETGVRAAIRTRLNNSSNYIYDEFSKDYVLLPSAASNYKSNDNVYAAYASVTSSLGGFGYKIGVRAESSNYSGELAESKQSFSNKYPISLFPSLFVSRKLADDQELQLSYTRRINRPNFFQLIPFMDSTDKLNITQGNPGLVPEFTQSLELNYLKQFAGNNSFLASLYYKQTNNLITNYLSSKTDASGNPILVNTFVNANSAYSAGAELTAQNTLTKWWSTSSNINFYNSKINTENVSDIQQSAQWSWFAKLNNNFKLPENFSVQLTGMYQSKTNLPVNTNQGGPGGGGPPGMTAQSASQGYINPFYAVDIAVKKTLLNNKVSISLSMNDIFKSRKQDQYSYSEYFTQQYSRVRDPQMLRLNLSYNFGKIDANLFKRKSSGTGQTGSELQ